MLAIILKALFSRAGLVGMALTLLVALFGVQELRLTFAQHGEAAAKAVAAAAVSAEKASEALRTKEHAEATASLAEAEQACAGRVAAAVKSGSAIRTITGGAVARDPTTHCPLRELVPAGELRDALHAPAP